MSGYIFEDIDINQDRRSPHVTASMIACCSSSRGNSGSVPIGESKRRLTLAFGYSALISASTAASLNSSTSFLVFSSLA